MPNFTRLLFVWLVAVLALAAAPPRAWAQHSSMSMSIFNDEGTFTPELSRSDLDVFKRVLSMKPEETRAMEDLYAAYCNALKTEGGVVRTFVAGVMEESEAMMDQRLLEKAQTRLKEWEKRSEQLKKSFIEDLKALLTKDQEARWPIVERELRRLKKLGSGRVPGEQPDLVKMVEDLPAEAKRSAAIGDLLERYSQDLDRALVSRTAFLEEHKGEFEDLVKSNPAEAERLYRRASREREALSNVNEKYLREICAELPPREAQTLKDRYFKVCYPLLSKATRGEKYIVAAGKLEDLTREQRGQVEAILAEYDRERRTILAKMGEALREQRLNELPENLRKALNPPPPDDPRKRYNDWAQGLPEGHPMLPLRKSRFELDKAYRGRIDGVLTAEQRGKLPDLAVDAVTFYDDSPYGL